MKKAALQTSITGSVWQRCVLREMVVWRLILKMLMVNVVEYIILDTTVTVHTSMLQLK